MEMQQIRYFLAVAELLNFTRTAERCQVAQPSLTRGIQKLESELGGDLFRRERSTTHLTELGKLMRPSLQTIYDSATSAKELANSFHIGDRMPVGLAIGHTISISVLSVLLAELARVLPGSEIQLHRGVPGELAKRMKAGDMEIAVSCSMDDDWERLNAWPLFRERFVVMVPPTHDFAELRSINIERLAGLTLLPRPCARETAEIEASLQKLNLHQNTNYQTCSDGDLLALVKAGIGCAFLPETSVERSAHGRLEVIEDEFWRTVQLFSVAGRPRSLATDTLLKMLRAVDWDDCLVTQPIN
ncbi:MAG: LysR family transcriptional regulator [Hyphomicrobiaceae bacterium]